MADMKSLLQSNDEWLRHRIRAIYWKQWKKVKTKYHRLKEIGMGLSENGIYVQYIVARSCESPRYIVGIQSFPDNPNGMQICDKVFGIVAATEWYSLP